MSEMNSNYFRSFIVEPQYSPAVIDSTFGNGSMVHEDAPANAEQVVGYPVLDVHFQNILKSQGLTSENITAIRDDGSGEPKVTVQRLDGEFRTYAIRENQPPLRIMYGQATEMAAPATVPATRKGVNMSDSRRVEKRRKWLDYLGLPGNPTGAAQGPAIYPDFPMGLSLTPDFIINPTALSVRVNGGVWRAKLESSRHTAVVQEKESAEQRIAEVLRNGASIGKLGGKTGLAVLDKVEFSDDGPEGKMQSRAYTFINPDLSMSERAGLGTLTYREVDRDEPGMADVHRFDANSVIRWRQACELEFDKNEPNRTPLTGREAAEAFGGGAATGSALYGIENIPIISNELAGAFVGAPANLAEISHTATNIAVAALVGGMVLKLLCEPRGERTRGYKISDLESRSNAAREHIAAEDRGGIRIPNDLISLNLTTEQAIAAGLLDESGLPNDLDIDKDGLHIKYPETPEESMEIEVKFGDLFKTLLVEYEDPAMARNEWLQRFQFLAQDTAQTVVGYQDSLAQIERESKVDRFTETGASKRTIAAQAESDDAVTAVTRRIVDILSADMESRFEAQVEQLITLKDDEIEKANTVDMSPIRMIVFQTVENLCKTSTYTLELIDAVNDYLDGAAEVLTHNAQNEQIYKGLLQKFGGKPEEGKLELPNWDSVLATGIKLA